MGWAAFLGHMAVVQRLLNHTDVEPDPRDRHGQTPRSLATQSSPENIVRVFLQRGDVDVNLRNEYGWTPHQSAVCHG